MEKIETTPAAVTSVPNKFKIKTPTQPCLPGATFLTEQASTWVKKI